jgi:hypothetical protein
MDAGQIAAIAGVSVFAAGIAVAIPLLLRRAKRLYISRFTALGARNIVNNTIGVHCELDRNGRTWKLGMLAPRSLKRSASLTREETPRFVAHVELAHPAPFDLQIVPFSDEPLARRDHERVEVPDLPEKLEARAASPDATRALTPDVLVALQRAYDVLTVDLEVRVRRASRTIECTKLYGARDLPAFVDAVEALVTALDRALA